MRLKADQKAVDAAIMAYEQGVPVADIKRNIVGGFYHHLEKRGITPTRHILRDGKVSRPKCPGCGKRVAYRSQDKFHNQACRDIFRQRVRAEQITIVKRDLAANTPVKTTAQALGVCRQWVWVLRKQVRAESPVS